MTLELTIEEINKYNLRIPRYTSYPTVPNWQKQGFGPEHHIANLREIGTKSDPISLYIHIPFCIRKCKFCACNTIITHRKDKSVRYLEYLQKEIRKTREYIGERDKVIQLHFGGGTPTHLTPAQLDELLTTISSNFTILEDAELSIEIHPSVTTKEHIDILAKHGFSRLSVGVQDFDPLVQEKLNRHQTYQETADLIAYARQLGFSSINTDLIYGLPYQSYEGFMHTIDQLLLIQPDRIAVYSYAHFPQVFPHQKSIPLIELPGPEEKINRFINARKKLLDAGYKQVGFDHFALESDDLWQSYLNKTLRRNFMGYTTKASTDLIAFGYSAISELGNSYAQNTKDMDEYERLIDAYGTATVKGHQLSEDDKHLKSTIMNILCLGEIARTDLQSVDALANMETFVAEGLCEVTPTGWQLTQKGTLFARVVAANFDAYLSGNQFNFSNTI